MTMQKMVVEKYNMKALTFRIHTALNSNSNTVQHMRQYFERKSVNIFARANSISQIRLIKVDTF